MPLLTAAVVPHDLNGGYRIAGGTITTDTSLTAITAWNIQVAGDLPYTFAHDNPGATDDGAAFNITPSQITFSAIQTGNTSARFVALDNTSTICADCIQSLIWTELGPPGDALLAYFLEDRLDGSPSVSAEVLLPVGEVVLATAIPEPSATVLSLFGLSVAGLGVRSTHRFNKRLPFPPFG
jgi:hypothetical protein